MILMIVLMTIFILSFSLLFIWIHKENEKDTEEEKMGFLLKIVVASVLALLITGVIAFFLFILLGSTNIITTLFTLDMNRKDLLLMSMVYLLFIVTLDNVFQLIVKMMTQHVRLFYFLMLWVRMMAFYLIGSFFHLPHMTNVLISGGVALIISVIELFYEWSQEKK